MNIDLATLTEKELYRVLWLYEEMEKLHAEIAQLHAEWRAMLMLISDDNSDDIQDALKAEMARRRRAIGQAMV